MIQHDTDTEHGWSMYRIQLILGIRYRTGGYRKTSYWIHRILGTRERIQRVLWTRFTIQGVMVQDTADTRDQRKDTADVLDQVHNTRGDDTGYSGYWWLVRGDHEIQDTSVTGDQIQDTQRLLMTKGVNVQDTVDPGGQIQIRGIERPDTGYSDCWGPGSQCT